MLRIFGGVFHDERNRGDLDRRNCQRTDQPQAETEITTSRNLRSLLISSFGVWQLIA
jgi:hypothetical protein